MDSPAGKPSLRFYLNSLLIFMALLVVSICFVPGIGVKIAQAPGGNSKTSTPEPAQTKGDPQPSATPFPTMFPPSATPSSTPTDTPVPVALRGTWVQADSLVTQGKIDQMLDRATLGNFNAIFVNGYANGNASYDSAYVNKKKSIEPGFNPLAYLVPEAHRRNLKVHLWFVVGPMGTENISPVFAEHPDWMIVGPDGETFPWLNFNRPDVRQFIQDLMMEAVEKYQVDGLHFDYTRYPGPEWGFDPYSVEIFKNTSGLDPDGLRFSALPAYGQIESNPLSQPTTAQVLATFDDGAPAVTLNTFGAGRALLLNWNASERNLAIGSEIIHRGVLQFLQPGASLYVLRSATNAHDYGYEVTESSMGWLKQMGFNPMEAQESGVSNLEPGSVLVLPNIYVVSTDTASQLAQYVKMGGSLIWIDGPSRSIALKDIQNITGMQRDGDYFKRPTWILATGENPLVPAQGKITSLAQFHELDAVWRAFRAQGISQMIQSIYTRVKTEYPQVTISVTITSDQNAASTRVLQDWPSWLEGGYVDVLIPRAYVNDINDLEPILSAWQPFMNRRGRVTLGLKSYLTTTSQYNPKSPGQLVDEVQMALSSLSNGFMIFDLNNTSNQELRALADIITNLP